MKRAIDSIIIPQDLDYDGPFKDRLLAQEKLNRVWFDRPAYYGTIAQVNDYHVDNEEDNK